MANLTLEEIEKVLYAHEAVEAAVDLEGTMATVVDDPYYELPINGLQIAGREAVYELYRRTLPFFDKLEISAEKRVHGLAPNTLCREAHVTVSVNGERVTGNYSVVIEVRDNLIAGERLYTDPFFARLFAESLGNDFINVPGVAKLPWAQYVERHPEALAPRG